MRFTESAEEAQSTQRIKIEIWINVGAVSYRTNLDRLPLCGYKLIGNKLRPLHKKKSGSRFIWTPSYGFVLKTPHEGVRMKRLGKCLT